MTEPVFRRLSYADISQVMIIEKLSFPQPWSKEGYAHELAENELAHFYGIFNGESLLAFGGFWLIVDEAHIANVAVHPDFRGKGLGELVMRQLMAVCQSMGALRMTLEVRESNLTALSLYEKLGFSIAGKRPHYYDYPDEAALIMWLTL